MVSPASTGRSTIAVLGPGGIGGLFAAVLARAGHDVVCLAGDSTVDVVRADGISVGSPLFGEFTAAVRADTELREPVDALLVTVKATALDGALERIPSGALGDGLVVPFLNGYDHMDTLAERFGTSGLAAGVVQVESSRTSPGRIRHGSGFVDVGLAPAGCSPRRVDELAAAFSAAGLSTTASADADALLWGKLRILAPFALLTTRYYELLGRVRTERAAELRAVATEVAAVSLAEGGPDDIEAALARYEAFPYDAKSSMLRDAEAGAPLELDAIGGAVLRAAARHGISVPHVECLVHEIARLPWTRPGLTPVPN